MPGSASEDFEARPWEKLSCCHLAATEPYVRHLAEEAGLGLCLKKRLPYCIYPLLHCTGRASALGKVLELCRLFVSFKILSIETIVTRLLNRNMQKMLLNKLILRAGELTNGNFSIVLKFEHDNRLTEQGATICLNGLLMLLSR